MALESKLQAKIIKHLKSCGWLVNKIIRCSNAGWPDIECYRNKIAVFIEGKAKGKKAKPLQEYRHEQLRGQGFEVYTIDNFEDYLKLKL